MVAASVFVENLPTFLTRNEVARAARISRRTVERLEQRGQLPAVRIGRQVRHRLSDVRALFGESVA